MHSWVAGLAMVLASTVLVSRPVLVHAQQTPAPSQSDQLPSSTTDAQDEPRPQQPPSATQDPQGQPQAPAQDVAPPSGVLIPSEPALPLLSTGVRAVRSARPNRVYERPYRGMFGRSAVGPVRDGLALTLGASASYDDNLLAAQGGGVTRGTTPIGGYFAGGSAYLDYSRPGQRLTITAAGGSELRYYERFNDTNGSHFANGSLEFLLGRRSRFAVRQSVSLASLYRFAALPGLTEVVPDVEADAELSVDGRDRLATSTGASFMHQLTSRSRFSFDYGYRRANSESTLYDLDVTVAGGMYEHNVGRNGTLRLGYHHQDAKYGIDATTRHLVMHNIDIGGSYARPLSFSRRTFVRFTGGTDLISHQATSAVPPVQYFRLSGVAGLDHEFGRTWTAAATYTRGMQFVEGFTDPFFMDSTRVSLRGLLSRRVEFGATASYVDGRLQLRLVENPYTSYAGTARIGYSFTEAFEASADYAYYNYSFAGRGGLPGQFASRLGRHSFRVGIRYWLPLSR
jgi:hypothetical protein